MALRAGAYSATATFDVIVGERVPNIPVRKSPSNSGNGIASMIEHEHKKKRSLEFHFFRGSAWALAVRWTVRLLGLISTIILARLLTPADFGVVAIAMLLAGAIEVFSQTGAWIVLVRHPAPTREHYDSAWTVSVFLGVLLGAAIWATAPLTAIYFHEPRAAAVVHIVAFRTALGGLANIGVVNFRRDLRFRAQYAYDASPSVVSFFIMLGCALWLRNYWALVAGIMSQQMATIALSYVLEPYRPRFSFSKVREIWSFSAWSLFRAVGVYLNGQIDKLAIGGFSGAATMGRYEVATDVGTSPTVEINAPMVNTLYSVLSKVQNDPVRRRELYLRVLAWSAVICTSTSVGVALVTSDMVDLVLGRQWVDVKPLIPWLALAYGVFGLTFSAYSAFDVMGLPRKSAEMQWTRVVGLVVCICPVAIFLHSPLAIAITRFAVTLAITPTLVMAVARVVGFRVWDFLLALWRPLAGSIAMTIAVLGMNSLLQFAGPIRLAIDVFLGATIYASTLLALWLAAGRPDGPEAPIWALLAGWKTRIA